MTASINIGFASSIHLHVHTLPTLRFVQENRLCEKDFLLVQNILYKYFIVSFACQFLEYIFGKSNN